MGHDRQTATIRSVTAQIATLTGVPPRVIEEPGAIRIETDVTEGALRHWPRLLAVLDLGTSFGLTDTATGQIAWLRFERADGSPS